MAAYRRDRNRPAQRQTDRPDDLQERLARKGDACERRHPCLLSDLPDLHFDRCRGTVGQVGSFPQTRVLRREKNTPDSLNFKRYSVTVRVRRLSEKELDFRSKMGPRPSGNTGPLHLTTLRLNRTSAVSRQFSGHSVSHASPAGKRAVDKIHHVVQAKYPGQVAGKDGQQR